MDYKELNDKIIKHKWLTDIANDYRKYIRLIETEKEFFRVESIKYTARGPAREMEINCHKSIPHQYILEGLKAALEDVQREINFLEDVLKQVNEGIKSHNLNINQQIPQQ